MLLHNPRIPESVSRDGRTSQSEKVKLGRENYPAMAGWGELTPSLIPTPLARPEEKR